MNYTKLRKALGLFSVKTLAAVLSFALVAPFTAIPALAYSNSQDQTAAYYNSLANSAIKLGGTVAAATNASAASTTTIIMNLMYTGPAASASVTIGASSITFYAPQGTVDTTIGNATFGATGGTFDLSVASGATLGQLCDLINGVQGPFALSGNANGGAPTGGNYHCTLVGAIRSDPSTNYLPSVVQAANVNNLAAVGGYMVPSSTAALISLGIIPETARHIILNYCTVNSAGTPNVQVFGVKAKDGIGASATDLFGNVLTDATLAWISPALVANTTTNEPLSTIVAQPWIEFGGGSAAAYKYSPGPAGGQVNVPTGQSYNGHVVIRVNNYGAGAALQASTNFLSCNWIEK